MTGGFMADVPEYPSYNLAKDVSRPEGPPMAAIESMVFGALMRAAVTDHDGAEFELVTWLDSRANPQ